MDEHECTWKDGITAKGTTYIRYNYNYFFIPCLQCLSCTHRQEISYYLMIHICCIWRLFSLRLISLMPTDTSVLILIEEESYTFTVCFFWECWLESWHQRARNNVMSWGGMERGTRWMDTTDPGWVCWS